MSILTKEERRALRYDCEDATCSWLKTREEAQIRMSCPYRELLRALDTIETLEADMLHLKTDLFDTRDSLTKSERELGESRETSKARVEELEQRYDAVCGWQSHIIDQVQDIAQANCDTKLIDGTHAVLKEILEVIGAE